MEIDKKLIPPGLSLVDRWQPLLFGCFLAIGCQKVPNRLFNGYDTVKWRFWNRKATVAFFKKATVEWP